MTASMHLTKLLIILIFVLCTPHPLPLTHVLTHVSLFLSCHTVLCLNTLFVLANLHLWTPLLKHFILLQALSNSGKIMLFLANFILNLACQSPSIRQEKKEIPMNFLSDVKDTQWCYWMSIFEVTLTCFSTFKLVE